MKEGYLCMLPTDFFYLINNVVKLREVLNFYAVC